MKQYTFLTFFLLVSVHQAGLANYAAVDNSQPIQQQEEIQTEHAACPICFKSTENILVDDASPDEILKYEDLIVVLPCNGVQNHIMCVNCFNNCKNTHIKACVKDKDKEFICPECRGEIPLKIQPITAKQWLARSKDATQNPQPYRLTKPQTQQQKTKTPSNWKQLVKTFASEAATACALGAIAKTFYDEGFFDHKDEDVKKGAYSSLGLLYIGSNKFFDHFRPARYEDLRVLSLSWIVGTGVGIMLPQLFKKQKEQPQKKTAALS